MQVYKSISGDLWSMFKKYMTNVPMTEEEWDVYYKELDDYLKRYEDTKYKQYAREYGVACMRAVEIEYRKRKGLENG